MLFQNKKVWSEYEKLSFEECLGIYVKWYNLHEVDRILSMLSEDVQIDSTWFGAWNRKIKVNEFLPGLFYSFPNFSINPLTLLCDSHRYNVITSEINLTGQQIGVYIGNPSTGKRFSLNGMLIVELNMSDKKVKNIRIFCDSRMIFKQLEIMKF